MLGRLATFCAGRRSRWLVIAAWLLLAAALAPFQQPLQQRAADESRTFEARGAESARAAGLLDRHFSKRGAAVAVVVYHDPRRPITAAAKRIYDDARALCAPGRIPDLRLVVVAGARACGEIGPVLGPQVQPSPLSRDRSAALSTISTTDDATETVVRDVATIRARVPAPDGPGLRAYVSGDAGFDADRSAAVEGIDGTLLLITATLVVVLLLLVYRSPVMALVPLVVVAVAYLCAAGLIYGLVKAGATTISGQSAAILIVLMFGAGTDYCLLAIARYREELRASDPGAAIVFAVTRSGPAVFTSGAIVAAAMLVLALADFNATREMGPVLTAGVAVTMAAALTLLPALLSVLGRAAFWPAGTAARPPALWARVGSVVRREPALVALACTSLLVAGALGNLEGRGTLTFTDAFRSSPDSVLGAELIRSEFTPGRVAPLEIVAGAAVAPAVQDALIDAPEVDTVIGDSRSDGGGLISLQGVLAIDPLAQRATDAIPRLRAVARASGGSVWIGGVTAEAYDNERALAADAKLIVPLITLVVFLFLVVLLRALVAPLYVIATVLLSYAFAIGVSGLVFTHVFGQPGSDPNLPIFTFIFLVALGVDYNIFLIARIREEARSAPARDAVIRGLERTGRVITSAGLVLAGTFASLMALELEALFQLGFTVAFGLLVDTFVIRSFLVPSIAYLLGDRNWWPGRVRQSLS